MELGAPTTKDWTKEFYAREKLVATSALFKVDILNGDGAVHRSIDQASLGDHQQFPSALQRTPTYARPHSTPRPIRRSGVELQPARRLFPFLRFTNWLLFRHIAHGQTGEKDRHCYLSFLNTPNPGYDSSSSSPSS